MSRVTASTIRNRSMASFGTGGDDPHQVRRGDENPRLTGYSATPRSASGGRV